jgi:dTDP-4-dehydrorhamnose reductase
MLLIGGNGLIGQALQDELQILGSDYVVANRTHKNGECDSTVSYSLETGTISGLQKLESSFKRVAVILGGISSPTAVFANPSYAYRTNFVNTVKIINELEENGFKSFFVSSVEVFPGESIEYTERDKTRPLNVYGALKLRVEEYVKNCVSKCTIVRTSWNIASRGEQVGRDPVQQTYLSLLKDEPKMSVDTFFTPICANTFSNALVKLTELDHHLDCVHIAGTNPISRAHFADLILRHSLNNALRPYKKAFHHQIYPSSSETRGRLNGLSTAELRQLISFNPPEIESIIQNRVRALDRMVCSQIAKHF